jgi:hypothetical protein
MVQADLVIEVRRTAQIVVRRTLKTHQSRIMESRQQLRIILRTSYCGNCRRNHTAISPKPWLHLANEQAPDSLNLSFFLWRKWSIRRQSRLCYVLPTLNYLRAEVPKMSRSCHNILVAFSKTISRTSQEDLQSAPLGRRGRPLLDRTRTA